MAFSGTGVKLTQWQFPLRAAYAVIFNNCQGKTLDKAVDDLRVLPFAHGQLHVALSCMLHRRQGVWLLCDREQHRASAQSGVYTATVNVMSAKCCLRACLRLAEGHSCMLYPEAA